MRSLFKFLIFCCLIGACREDLIVENTVIDEPIPKNSIIHEFDIQGFVFDQDGNDLAGAALKIGNKETQSDEYGYFEFKNIEGSEEGVYIHATLSGYVEGGELLVPNGDIAQQVKISLKEKDASQGFKVADGANLDFGQDVVIQIPPNAFPSGSNIEVNNFFINEVNQEFKYLFPSSTIGINKSREKRFVNIAGSIAVEFKDELGNIVQPIDGAKIKLQIPITGDVSQWPETIPLWSLNTNTGYWEEESIATKEGNVYVGEVEHFSWWTAGVMSDPESVCFKVQSPDGTPIAGLEIITLSWENGFIISGITDKSGSFCTNLEVGDENLVVIFDNCLDVLYEDVYTATAGEEELIITIQNTIEDLVFTGNITRCDGAEVTDAYVAIKIGSDKVIADVSNGQYSYTSYCSFSNNDVVEILAVDKTDFVARSITIDIADGEQIYERNIQLCESLETYLSYTNTTKGTEILFTDCKGLKNPTETLIVAKTDPVSGQNLLLGIEGFEIGSFGTSLFDHQSNTSLPDELSTTLELYGEVDEFIMGSFKGVNDQGDQIEGEFKALRTK